MSRNKIRLYYGPTMPSNKIRFYYGRDDIVVAVGREAPDSPLVTEWARRHGAEPYHAIPLAITDDDVAYERGLFRAQGDVDAYQDDKQARRQRASRDYREGWIVRNISALAVEEAEAVDVVLRGSKGRRYDRKVALLRERGYSV